MARRKPTARRDVSCYLCGAEFDVSSLTMSTTCPGCNKAIKIEDVTVKSYLPVTALQTCGKITITKRGRVAAKDIQSGEGIACEGTMEGAVSTGGAVKLGAKASWKGKLLKTPNLTVAEGAELLGEVNVPLQPRPLAEEVAGGGETEKVTRRKPLAKSPAAKAKKVVAKKAAKKAAKKTTTRKKASSKAAPAGDDDADAPAAAKKAAKKTKKKATKKKTTKKKSP